MNAAARNMASVSWFAGDLSGVRLNKTALRCMLLSILVLLSALSLVYLKSWQRQMVSDLQSNINTTKQLEVEQSQLLLEQSTWATPGRVAQIAQNHLAMVVPRPGQIRYVTQ